MSSPDVLAAIAHLLPAEHVGAVGAVTPISMGLSGAGVYAVTAAEGELILRVQAAGDDPDRFGRQLVVQRRAAEHGVAPPIVHVDEAARAVVSRRVAGVPLPAALADPAQRGSVVAGVVAQLRRLHEIDPAGVAETDPVAYARDTFSAQRIRPGFPGWASGLEPVFADIEAILSADRRRVVSHNDCNPGNILWDGARAWFVDWDVAGLGHPFYDLAVLALFLQLDDPTAHALLVHQMGAPIDERDRAAFAALRRLAALLLGLTFLVLVPDLSLLPASAPTLSDCYAGFHAGTLDLQEARGRAAFALAILQIGVGPAASL